MQTMRIYLASRSERRRHLLNSRGFDVVVIEPRCEEPPLIAPAPRYVLEAARLKALSALDDLPASGGIVLGADTVAEIDGTPVGKPAGVADAKSILRRCSGKTQFVYTGMYLLDTRKRRSEEGVASAKVKMRHLSETDIERIIKEGRSLGRAGAYAIKEDGADEFAEVVDGDMDTVVGLSMQAVEKMFVRIGC